MHAISSYHGNRPTNKHTLKRTHKPTDRTWETGAGWNTFYIWRCKAEHLQCIYVQIFEKQATSQRDLVEW